LDHLLLPLENLRQEVGFFAREESLRLLHVVVDSALHGPALDVLRAVQWSPDNRRAVFVLEDPTDLPTERWIAWCEQIVMGFASISEAYAKSGIKLDEISPPAEGEPLIRFAVVLKAASEILGKPPAATSGLTVIFSTTIIREPDRWLAFIDEIINRTPSLGNIRWGWMETGAAIGNELVSRLGKENALHVECRVDSLRQQEELEDLLSSLTEARDDAVGPAAAGAAAPAVSPPSHPTDPPKAGVTMHQRRFRGSAPWPALSPLAISRCFCSRTTPAPARPRVDRARRWNSAWDSSGSQGSSRGDRRFWRVPPIDLTLDWSSPSCS
jgi:hypothetical protein